MDSTTMQELLHNWVVVLLLVLLVLLAATATALAFVQGREVQLWPPKFGGRPAQKAKSGSGKKDDGKRAGYHEFTVADARDFYAKIAPNYDQRNSGGFLRTQLKVVALIRSQWTRGRQLHVLDLGGGTGKLVAIPFFDEEDIRWTYVDNCPSMAALFQDNLEGSRLEGTAEVRLWSVATACDRLSAAAFDVIILSFTLSSMTEWPDFVKLRRLLRPDGVVIVSDAAHHGVENPLYEVPVDKTVYALKIRTFSVAELTTRAKSAGFAVELLDHVGVGNTDYSFVVKL